MRVKLINNKINISFKYDWALVNWVKSLDAREYSATTRSWSIPLTSSLETIKRLQDKGFIVDNDVISHVEANHVKAREVEAIAVMSDTVFDSPLPLYDFQRVCCEFMVKTGSCLNASGVGTGKTIENIATTIKNGTKKNLVISPKSLLLPWEAEILRFAPQFKTFVVSGNKKEREEIYQRVRTCDDPHFLIISYELARIDILSIGSYETLIIDEAHRCGNTRTKTYKVLKKLCEGSKHRYLNTATPVMNRPSDLYGVINLIQPGFFGNWWSFMDHYTVRNSFGGVMFARNTEELAQKIKPFTIRKTLEECAPELPSMIIEDIKFDLSAKELDLYKKIKQEILFSIEEGMINKIESPMLLQHTLVKMIKLIQLTCSLSLLGDDNTSSKLEILKDRLEDLLAGDDKAIIFVQFKEMAKILERELKEYNPVMITGDVTGQDRADNLKKFQENDSHKILISTDAGGEGLNIDRANIIFHFSLPYSYGKYIQRNGRIKRLTQKKPMVVYNLIANKSLDVWLSKMIKGKSDLSNTILGDIPITMDSILEVLE